MATGITLAGSGTEHRGLTYWMERVLRELEKMQEALDADAVHDLRVAIRRCRSVAAVMAEVDPDASWPEMRKLPRKLFRELGALRDTQVLEEWTKQLSAEGDAVHEALLAHFAAQENELREKAIHAAGKFDEKAWQKLEPTLRTRSRLIPPDGLAAECLALERLEAAKELHVHALRTTKTDAWHALRIGVKKFRYTVESLLPARYEAWGSDLKQVQDLLGEVHDLDVLAATSTELATPELRRPLEAWKERLAIERQKRLDTYRELTVGKRRLWHEWRRGLADGSRLEAAGLARLRATGRAMDVNSRRTAQISGLAMRLFDGLARSHAAPVFSDKDLRRILRAASRVFGIGSGLASKVPQKAARHFLLKMDVPAGWSPEEWKLMSGIVRYHRGPQPQTKHKNFAKLSELEQGKICAAAGVLRLARILRKCGVQSSKGLRLEKSVDAVIVWVPGLIDSEDTAAGIAAGKHLLETCIGSPLLLKAIPVVSNLVELRQKVEDVPTSIASD